MRNGWRENIARSGADFAGPASEGLAQGFGTSSARLGVGVRACAFPGLTPNQRTYLSPDRRDLPAHYWRAPDVDGDSRIDRLMRWDFANYLPEYVLRKADLATMAHGLELRAPLLDHRFVEAVLALPQDQRYTRPPKMFLAKLAPELVDLHVFARKKRGFNPPLGGWLSNDLHDRLSAMPASLAALTQRADRCGARAGDARRVCTHAFARRADTVARHSR